MTEKEKSSKEIILKKKFVNDLIEKFKNYVPDFTLDEISQSEKYLDFLSFLKVFKNLQHLVNLKMHLILILNNS